MKRLVRNLLVVAVALVGSMPVRSQASSDHRPCERHGGVGSATARPAGRGFDVTVTCADRARRGPIRLPVSGAYPCASNGGVHSATVRPGAGVIEIIVYCNDGQSEGPYTYEIR